MDKEDIITLLKVTDDLNRLQMFFKEITGVGYETGLNSLDGVYNILEKYANLKDDDFFDVMCDYDNNYEDKYRLLFEN